MNAIILAGDRKAAYPLCGINKAFLLLEGWPLLIHVLTALDQASCIETIYIIGPRKIIMEAIEKALPVFLFSKKMEVLEQQESLIENILYAYRFCVGKGHKEEALLSFGASPPSLPPSLPPVLFLPADIPLVTPEEIDAFVSKADMNQYDYCLGVTSAEHLKQFHPKRAEPGIKMPYLYLKDQVCRINNLHLARLSCPSAGSLIQTMYNHRYQKSVWNRLGMVFALLKTDRAITVLALYFFAQAAVLLSRFGFHRFATFFRRFLLLHRVEREISLLLNMCFKVIETNGGGAALDIDDEATYKTISLVFAKWRARLTRFHPGRQASCPFEAKVREMAS